jgi:hypothetical protein
VLQKRRASRRNTPSTASRSSAAVLMPGRYARRAQLGERQRVRLAMTFLKVLVGGGGERLARRCAPDHRSVPSA